MKSNQFKMKFKMKSNEIPIVFHRVSNYDYHFIIKELANEFEREFEWIGENNEKYKTFCMLHYVLCVAIKKEIIKIDKDSNKNFETIYTK